MSFSLYDEDGARTSHHTHCCIGARRATHCTTGLIIGLLDTTSLEEGGEAMQTVREWSRRGCWNYQRENPMSKAHASSFGGCLITQDVLITLPILLLAALFNILQELNWMLFYVLNVLFKLGQWVLWLQILIVIWSYYEGLSGYMWKNDYHLWGLATYRT